MQPPRHILITGAAGAIGGALVECFAAQYPQAQFTLVDLKARALAAAVADLSGRAAAAAWDLSDVDSLPGLWADAVAERGPVDMLVNCAGIMEIRSLAGTGWALGKRLLDINFNAPMQLMALALPAMVRAGSGCVINISSMAGRVPIRGCSYYGAAKAGLGMASEIARLELQDQGVDVITVYPGPVRSGLEAHARSQVKRGLISRFIPTGEPAAIASRILNAYMQRLPRVIYPDVYRPANLISDLSGWVTSRLSPNPLH